MASYIDLENVVSDPNFQKRILYGLKQKGFELIMAGNKDKELISSLFIGPYRWPIPVIANYSIAHPLFLASGPGITDSDLQTVINDVYNYLMTA